jgi:Type II secretory pathway, ATPase PulE/Tfp pilus assembly pathway, ATPase PilB
VEAAANLPAPLPLTLTAETSRIPLGTLLVRDRLISTEQLELALAEKEQTGRRLGEIVVAHGWVPAAELARLLAEQHGLEYIDLSSLDVDPAALSLLPEKYARRYAALPIRFLAEDLVLVAVVDPTNVVASDDLRIAIGLNVRVAVAAAPDLAALIDKAHRPELFVDHDPSAEEPEDTEEDIREAPATTPPRSRWSTR